MMSKTEALVKINSLKDKHELLKKEIIDLTYQIENKQTELSEIESEYVRLIEILTQDE